jgi:hypothetical protein
MSCGAEGVGEEGVLGHGKLYGKHRGAPTPTLLPSTAGGRIISTSAGRFFNAAVSAAGTAYTWGKGHAGRLGHGDVEGSLVPIKCMRWQGTGLTRSRPRPHKVSPPGERASVSQGCASASPSSHGCASARLRACGFKRLRHLQLSGLRANGVGIPQSVPTHGSAGLLAPALSQHSATRRRLAEVDGLEF